MNTLLVSSLEPLELLELPLLLKPILDRHPVQDPGPITHFIRHYLHNQYSPCVVALDLDPQVAAAETYPYRLLVVIRINGEAAQPPTDRALASLFQTPQLLVLTRLGPHNWACYTHEEACRK